MNDIHFSHAFYYIPYLLVYQKVIFIVKNCSELMMKTHILKIISSCFSQFRRICQLCRLVRQDFAWQLVSALIQLRLDYSNSLLSRLLWSTIQPMQHVMNAATCIIMNLSICYHVKPVLKELHWLPVEQRIMYKIWLLVHLIHIRQAPQYWIECASTVFAAVSRYGLRSTDTADYVLRRTTTKSGEHGFC